MHCETCTTYAPHFCQFHFSFNNCFPPLEQANAYMMRNSNYKTANRVCARFRDEGCPGFGLALVGPLAHAEGRAWRPSRADRAPRCLMPTPGGPPAAREGQGATSFGLPHMVLTGQSTQVPPPTNHQICRAAIIRDSAPPIRYTAQVDIYSSAGPLPRGPYVPR